MGDKGISRVGGMIEGRAWGGGNNLRSTLMGRDRIKRENRSNGEQDRMEGNIVSLIQHDYYGSHLQNYTDLAYIELLAFQREGVGREGGREVGSQSFRNNCRILFLLLGNKKYR